MVPIYGAQCLVWIAIYRTVSCLKVFCSSDMTVCMCLLLRLDENGKKTVADLCEKSVHTHQTHVGVIQFCLFHLLQYRFKHKLVCCAHSFMVSICNAQIKRDKLVSQQQSYDVPLVTKRLVVDIVWKVTWWISHVFTVMYSFLLKRILYICELYNLNA